MRLEPRRTRPTWWQLYAVALLLLAVMWLVETLVEGAGLRIILQLLAVMAGFTLMGAWRRHNRVALELEKGRHPTPSRRARG
jgi:hypothetical protein